MAWHKTLKGPIRVQPFHKGRKREQSSPGKVSSSHLKGLEFDQRIFGAEAVGNVPVCGPIVFPALAIEIVPESVSPACFQGDGCTESAILSLLHGMGSGFPLVEFAAQRGVLCLYFRGEFKRHPA